ncbi:serine hydrolase [Bryobacterales bacterium F-183]|nr:serine hydrolase [Bryobacterales bacterium F-183]
MLLALLALPAFAQELRLDALFRLTAATRIRNGFEVLIVQDGQEVYSKSFGPWERGRQVPIASATKWLSGAVIMSLVDSGILSLDDRASQFLPYMTGEKADITLRQLMSHTAGFGGEFPLVDSCLGDEKTTLADCAERLASKPLAIPAGTGFIYSGAGMQIAGHMAEVASGMPWQTLFQERIAKPLGLTQTDYEYQGPTENPRISGGGRSTAAEYMKFLIMVSQRGVYEGVPVLSEAAVAEMLRDQTAGVPIVESPFADLEADVRYGIGNWVESPDVENSSPGALGFTPWIDSSRNILVVVSMQNLMVNFHSAYFRMQEILQNQ